MIFTCFLHLSILVVARKGQKASGYITLAQINAQSWKLGLHWGCFANRVGLSVEGVAFSSFVSKTRRYASYKADAVHVIPFVDIVTFKIVNPCHSFGESHQNTPCWGTRYIGCHRSSCSALWRVCSRSISKDRDSTHWLVACTPPAVQNSRLSGRHKQAGSGGRTTWCKGERNFILRRVLHSSKYLRYPNASACIFLHSNTCPTVRTQPSMTLHTIHDLWHHIQSRIRLR